MDENQFDVAIIGSGFSGSILAWTLASQGLKVVIIDPARHPRFAIGESSTPIADTLLRRLGDRYRLQPLVSMSTYDSWQRDLPELACGRKRGFTYYAHDAGKPFGEAGLGSHSLLVAASASDEMADTHWYRRDVDQYLFDQARHAGATDGSGFRVVSIADAGRRWRLDCAGDQRRVFSADWVVDASGSAGVLARLMRSTDRHGELRTNTQTLFGHFRGVPAWTTQLDRLGQDRRRDPFDADDSAQHHLLHRSPDDVAWMWMLRMNNGITSVGVTSTKPIASDQPWAEFPSVATMIDSATQVEPRPKLRRTGRLQRWFDPVPGDRCVMLPTAAMTMDPLHSTGIAHALAGVDRIASLILTGAHRSDRSGALARYTEVLATETRLLDRLVSTAYATMGDFDRFKTACMLYFAGAIVCEEAYQRGDTPEHLWNAGDTAYADFVSQASVALMDPSRCDFESEIRERIKPWNSAGLMNADCRGRYAYTATKQ